jgi:hypothetical protein
LTGRLAPGRGDDFRCRGVGGFQPGVSAHYASATCLFDVARPIEKVVCH